MIMCQYEVLSATDLNFFQIQVRPPLSLHFDCQKIRFCFGYTLRSLHYLKTFNQCFGSGKKYYGSGSDLKIVSRIRIRILLEITLYCFPEVYF